MKKTKILSSIASVAVLSTAIVPAVACSDDVQKDKVLVILDEQSLGVRTDVDFVEKGERAVITIATFQPGLVIRPDLVRIRIGKRKLPIGWYEMDASNPEKVKITLDPPDTYDNIIITAKTWNSALFTHDLSDSKYIHLDNAPYDFKSNHVQVKYIIDDHYLVDQSNSKILITTNLGSWEKTLEEWQRGFNIDSNHKIEVIWKHEARHKNYWIAIRLVNESEEEEPLRFGTPIQFKMVVRHKLY